jgi:hypothetical protein
MWKTWAGGPKRPTESVGQSDPDGGCVGHVSGVPGGARQQAVRVLGHTFERDDARILGDETINQAPGDEAGGTGQEDRLLVLAIVHVPILHKAPARHERRGRAHNTHTGDVALTRDKYYNRGRPHAAPGRLVADAPATTTFAAPQTAVHSTTVA